MKIDFNPAFAQPRPLHFGPGSTYDPGISRPHPPPSPSTYLYVITAPTRPATDSQRG